MKYFTTSWSLETLITHFFVLTIYAIFENYLIVIPKHVPEYFQVIEHVPRFGSPHCPWHWQWNDRSFWMPQGLYSAITYNQNWLIDCLSIGGQVFVQCANPSLMYSHVLSGTLSNTAFIMHMYTWLDTLEFLLADTKCHWLLLYSKVEVWNRKQKQRLTCFSIFLSDPSPIIGYACQWLTHWLTAV